MLKFRGNFTPINTMKLQNYIDKINSHIWENEQLKASLVLATYINYGLIEYGETTGVNEYIQLLLFHNDPAKS